MKDEAKPVKITIESDKYDLTDALAALDLKEMPRETDGSMEHEKINLTTDGEMFKSGKRVVVRYNESELTGMEGSVTEISFDESMPVLVTMMRSGRYATALTFEPGKRHICVYNTAVAPFEICIGTYTVNNTLLENGRIYIDYFIDIHGLRAERNRMNISVRLVENGR